MDEENDDKAKRIKSLEEMMKLQQIDKETFEKLRDEIIGGDINSVHLMKGLDFKLLERVRRGDHVLSKRKILDKDEAPKEEAEDVDDEFEELENKEIAPIKHEEKKKHGEMAPANLVPGGKRTRDMILADMKRAREEAKMKAGPTLGDKFRKIGAPRNETRIEKDKKGREVLITVDEHGNEKRKVRKVVQAEEPEPEQKGKGLLMPDKDAAPLGMVVPEAPKPKEEEDEDFDIFDDAGDDYDPLAGLQDGDEDSESEKDKEDGEVEDSRKPEKTEAEKKDSFDMPPPPRPAAPIPVKRNYFGDTTTAADEPADKKAAALRDPNFMAALKKASAIAAHATEVKSEEEAAREAKLKRMLQNQDRDAEDIDMGFGESRIADDEDFEDRKVKLSNWNGGEGDDSGDEGGKGPTKERKKGGKRKGDKDSAADVLSVMARRKKEGDN